MRLRSLPSILIACALLALGAAATARPPQLAQGLRLAIFDAWQRWQPREYRAAPVRVIDIDEESLARVGQWPWSRSRLAELLQRAHERGALSLALDLSLSEPDRTAPRRLAEQWSAGPRLSAELRALPDPDATLAAAFARLPIVTGFILGSQPGGRAPRAAAGFAIAGDPPDALPSFRGAVAALPDLENAARGNGSFNFTPDDDGVVRRLPLLLRLDRALYPSLAAEALRVAEGARGFAVRSSAEGVRSVRVGSRELPTDAEGQVWLHYTPSQRARFVPAWKLLAGDGALAPEELQGAIAFVGSSAAALRDLRFTPLGEAVAGVEIHAQLVEQVLEDSLLSRPDWAPGLEILITLALGALLIAAALRLGPLGSALAVSGAVVALGLGSWLAFARARLLLDPGIPALSALAAFATCFVPRQLQRERERRWIRRAFQSYISPNLVAHLLSHPDALRLGGERRECSFVLTDLEDFTPLVERSSPEALVGLLNEYLEGVVGIALRHEGTLDRVVGDAVAVLFSAPVEQPDHAQRALACALEIDRFSRSLRAARQGGELSLGRTRIGVHSGVVTIGNVGGQGLLDYRALGDPINTTARLEGANRLLGTHVCVSGELAARCPDFRGRPVGRLVLKGRQHAIEAFEPLDAETAAAPQTRAYLAAWRLLEAEDPTALPALEALAGDPVAAFHAERLRRGERGVLVTLGEK